MSVTARTIVLVASGGVLAFLSAWASIQVIASAWAACIDFEPPYGLALLVISFPLTAVTAWVALAVVVILSARLRWWWAALLGGLAALLITYLWVMTAVPMSDAASYAGVAEMGFPDCGPTGAPVWWPAFAPLLPLGESRWHAALLAAGVCVALLCVPGLIAAWRTRSRARAAAPTPV